MDIDETLQHMAREQMNQLNKCRHWGSVTMTIDTSRGNRRLHCDTCGRSVEWEYHLLQDAVEKGGKHKDFLRESVAQTFGVENEPKLVRLLLARKEEL